MIFEALQSELVGIGLHLLRLKLQKNPEFKLNINHFRIKSNKLRQKSGIMRKSDRMKMIVLCEIG